jgi:hypothetical protein
LKGLFQEVIQAVFIAVPRKYFFITHSLGQIGPDITDGTGFIKGFDHTGFKGITNNSGRFS